MHTLDGRLCQARFKDGRDDFTNGEILCEVGVSSLVIPACIELGLKLVLEEFDQDRLDLFDRRLFLVAEKVNTERRRLRIGLGLDCGGSRGLGRGSLCTRALVGGSLCRRSNGWGGCRRRSGGGLGRLWQLGQDVLDGLDPLGCFLLAGRDDAVGADLCDDQDAVLLARVLEHTGAVSQGNSAEGLALVLGLKVRDLAVVEHDPSLLPRLGGAALLGKPALLDDRLWGTMFEYKNKNKNFFLSHYLRLACVVTGGCGGHGSRHTLARLAVVVLLVGRVGTFGDDRDRLARVLLDDFRVSAKGVARANECFDALLLPENLSGFLCF